VTEGREVNFWRMLRREALQGGESVRGGMGNAISLLIGAIVVVVLLIILLRLL
jgi:hypothetical protein